MGFPIFSIIDIDEIVSALKDGIEFPPVPASPADSCSAPYQKPDQSAVDRYPCGLCEDRVVPESGVTLPTPEQIQKIEEYLKENRAV
jgi:hypothetical protein